MPASVIETIYQWSDVQSLLLRAGNSEVAFQYAFARKMFTATIALYRWFRHHCCARKVLGFDNSHVISANERLSALLPFPVASPELQSMGQFALEDLEFVESMAAGGQEASDIEADLAIAEEGQEEEEGNMNEAENAADSDEESFAHTANVTTVHLR